MERGSVSSVSLKEKIEWRKQTEDNLQAILNSTISVIYIKDLEGEYLYINRQFEVIMQVSKAYVVGKTDYDLFPKETADQFRKNDLEVLTRGQQIEFDEEAPQEDGIHYFTSVKFPLYTPDHNVYAVCGISTDVTERRKIEEALRKANLRSRTLLEGSPVCNKIIDLDSRLQYMSAAGVKMLKIDDIAPFYGTRFPPDFYPELTKVELTEKLERAKKGEGSTMECQAVDIEGNEIWFQTTFVPARDDSGRVEYVIATSVDITDRKKVDKLLNYHANHDALTGLVNRREFERRAERLLEETKYDQSEHALCFLDLDQFKIVNDTCGHIVGDEMLRQISILLQKTLRHHDTLARLGGDEFGVLIEHCSLDDAYRVATSLKKVIQDFVFPWEDRCFKVGVSMGLVPIAAAEFSFTELMKQADTACYVAKDKGRNRIHIYDTDDSAVALRHGEVQWVTRLNQALEEDRFSLYVQAIVPLDGGSKRHYELLIRMQGEQGEMIPPGAFLPAAERYSLASKIDCWVVNKAFEFLGGHPSLLEDVGFFAINLSGQSLTEAGFQDFVLNKFASTALAPEKICFEITETAAISNLNLAIQFIACMKQLGCHFALDDFGSGLSSFGYLKNMKVDYLKIDGMFVKNIVEDPIERAMVKSINEIGQVMGMKTIAEFVENDEIKTILEKIGIDYVQGYAVDKPISMEYLL